jgi:hypothetical protein
MKVRIESDSRWDALALARTLGRYRWYLVQTDPRHWNVYVELGAESHELPEDLRSRIDAWAEQRGLPGAAIPAVEARL